jgi:prepilin-type N-terminal cleavage/methylation domain-containing protein
VIVLAANGAMPPHDRIVRGFSLIEVLVASFVFAAIMLLALRSYEAAGNETRRSEGRLLLQGVLAEEERYYAGFHRYTDDVGPDGLGLATESQPGAFYGLGRLEVASDGQSVTATVDPRAAQGADPCGSLMLDSSGRRGASGSAAHCW